MTDFPPADPALEIVIASRGMSKGIAQTDGPQVVARGELAFEHFYVAAQAKNVSSPTSDGEVAGLVGIRTETSGFELSGSAAYKSAIAPVGVVDAEALELVGNISREIGRITPRVTVTWSPDDLGSTGRTTYAEAGLNYRLNPRITISSGVGRRERVGGPDYTAFNLGISHTLGRHFTFDARYFDTNKRWFGDPFQRRLVVSLRARF
jgi:uncharacterized protein (TIGR02001 family)